MAALGDWMLISKALQFRMFRFFSNWTCNDLVMEVEGQVGHQRRCCGAPGTTVVLDLEWEEQMQPKELKSLIQQAAIWGFGEMAMGAGHLKLGESKHFGGAKPTACCPAAAGSVPDLKWANAHSTRSKPHRHRVLWHAVMQIQCCSTVSRLALSQKPQNSQLLCWLHKKPRWSRTGWSGSCLGTNQVSFAHGEDCNAKNLPK